MTRLCFEVSPRSRRSIIESARLLRRSSGRTASHWFDVLRFAELEMPLVQPDFALTIGELREMGDAHGLTRPEQQVIQLRADVYEGIRQGKGRDRFTLAHEIGHYVMHTDPGLARRLAERAKLPAYKDSEWQADVFGGALLISIEAAQQHRTPEELSLVCGVTVAAANATLGNYRSEGFL